MKKYQRLRKGTPEREQAITQAERLYREGKSIRAVAADLDCSYGSAHGLIHESGMPLRRRGALTRKERSV